MVKRLVSSEDAVKEEMAWQMAEMIVKDITDLTSPPVKEALNKGESRRNSRVIPEEGEEEYVVRL